MFWIMNSAMRNTVREAVEKVVGNALQSVEEGYAAHARV